MDPIFENFSVYLEETNQLPKFELDESTFTAKDAIKPNHTYVKDVINKLLEPNAVIKTGETGEGQPVSIKDYDVDKLHELLDKEGPITSKDFDACIKNKNARWCNIFKGDFSGGSGVDVKTGSVKTFGSGAGLTAIQESMTAVLLELKCNGTALNIDETAVPDKFKKKSPIIKWLISSKPSAGTGICHYIDFPTKQDEDFAVAMASFLESWGPSLEKAYNADVKKLISSIFVHGITAKNWHFGHYGRKDMTSIPELRSYLLDDRCHGQKDDADKSDIVLFFNVKDARATMQAAMRAKNLDEHNMILNEAFVNKKLLGISLKQIGSTFNLIGVNFDRSLTNAIGQEINKDKIAAVIHNIKNTKQNTFDASMIENVQPAKSATATLTLHVNNQASIHVSKPLYLVFRTKGSDAISLILFEKGAKAYMGNAKKSFAKPEIFNHPGLNFNVKAMEDSMKDLPLTERINNIVKKFVDMIHSKGNIRKFALAFADAVGYSFQSDEEYVQLSAPYIKIY